MDKKCIVSFASFGRENYPKAQLNLIRACKSAGWDGDFYLRCLDGYCDEYLGEKIQLGSYPYSKVHGLCWGHNDAPYAFKPYLIQEAREHGYDKILWMDSTCRMLSNPNSLFEIAARKGIVAWDNLNYPVSDWITDRALEYLGETDQSLKGMSQIMACCILFDFTHASTSIVLNEWIQAAKDGIFQDDGTIRPGFKGSRHDQAVLSVLLHQHNIPLQEYGDGFCYYPHNDTLQFGLGPYFLINKGIGL
jgi:hypothetical protein